MADDSARERIKLVRRDDPRKGQREAPPADRAPGVEAGGRYSVLSLQPLETHCNAMGSVNGGVLAALLDSVMSAAVQTALPAGRGYLTSEITVKFLRPVFEATGEITARGQLVSFEGDVARAEGRILDAGDTVYATATAKCAVFDTLRRTRS